jgi:SPP1 family predicted phage head-tail adaptor
MLKCSQCENEKRWWTLAVQSPAGTAGDDGQVDLTSDDNWTTEGSIKAYFVSKGGREFVQAKQVQADQTHTLETISTNFSRGILPSWRLVFGSRKFEILSAVDVNEERRMVQIEAKERK